MMEITRAAHVDAPPDVVWQYVDDPERVPEWFTFAERLEHLSGEGVGRRQRQHGRWGQKHAEVDQVVTDYRPNELLAWRHEAERLGGKPAPRFASETLVSIRLEPEGQGTNVTLETKQEPASRTRGVVMRAFGQREVAKGMERSLERLAALLSTDYGLRTTNSP